MMDILNHLYRWTREQAAEDIATQYESWASVFVDFLYFASAMKMRVLEEQQTAEQETYKKAILAADILFPDGIALQVFDRAANKGKASRLHNLNGTDFVPYLLKYLAAKWKTSMYVRSVFDEKKWHGKEFMQKWIDRLQAHVPWLQCPFAWQCSYYQRGDGFPWKEFKEARHKDDSAYKIFWTGIGTPFQEIRSEKNRQMFDETPCIVIQLGGTLDFWSGYETRAPRRVVKARVLETPWRLLTTPKKNYPKVLAMFGVFRILRKRITSKEKRKNR